MKEPRGLRVHIEELVVDRAIAGDRQRIARSIERELGRLFAERGIPASLGSSATLPRLDAGQWTMTPGARPDAIGRQVARSVYRGLGR